MVHEPVRSADGSASSGDPRTPSPMDPPESMRQQTVPQIESRFKRKYVLGLIFSVVTFGVYGLWWHWNVHNELSNHLGRPMRGERIWIVFGLIYIPVVVMAVLARTKMRGSLPDVRGEVSMPFLGVVTFMAIAAVLSALVALVLFIIYVMRQYDAILEAKGALNIPIRGGSWRFLPMFLAGLALAFMPDTSFLINALGVGLVAAAYRYIQEDYNEIWDAVVRGQSRPTETVAPTTSPFPR